MFEILLRKFKKLKKTKEEMTKYCMRKAFKFLADKYKKGLEGKETTDFLKEYFEQLETEGFCIPFKKNSDDKTMNANFLRKVFASPTFASDYKQFLSTHNVTKNHLLVWLRKIMLKKSKTSLLLSKLFTTRALLG